MTAWIQFCKTSDKAQIPSFGSECAAGMDLFSTDSVTIHPATTTMVSTGLSAAIPNNHVGMICNRSSLSLKGLQVGGGIIDPDYRGEIKVILTNLGNIKREIKEGSKIAQILFIPICRPVVQDVSKLDKTLRGANGFGSTGQ